MATDTPETPKGPSVLDNPGEWLANKLQEANAEEPASEPTAPAPVEPEAVASETPQPQTTWKDLRFPEDDPEVHGFFRGKPLPEVLKSYSYAERKIQEQGHELSTLRTELAAVKALKDMLAPQPAPSKPKTLKDRYAEFGVDLETESITNPERVEAARLEILKQDFEAREQAKQAEERKKSEALTQQQQFEQAVIGAAEAARQRLGVPPSEYGEKVVGVMATIRARHGDQALLSDQAYEDYYVQLFGKPQVAAAPESAALPPPAAPAAPNPPGVKRSGTAAPAGKVPSLGAEQRRSIEAYGIAAGFKGEQLERYIERSAAALAALEKR